ncbi:hypothetical protein [Gimesia fumaroli]|jgi:hypothetical protein|uniref:Uncharacterized protein n=1 Tax=Gimesia fumaroli TaxID=2527976 RepID=A0A518IH05_9PLAN|nr:hypothetical protein [Gimesia fumaroli]QDV52365.1 hypothetical protein Enr17x_44270 [Gimesia fumaroli]
MYQSLIAILMLLSMLSHTLLGCGWHHAHDCHAGQSNSCQTVALCEHQAEDTHHDHEHAHHQHAEPASEEQPAAPESDPCQEGRCSYLASASVKVLEETPQFVDLLPAWDLLYSAQEKQYVEHMFQLASLSSIAAPGVRAQAQTTVWLL